MPTASPIISARVGALEDSVTTFEASSRAPMPTPMPTNAVSRFIPAASSEPKVSTRTSTATPTPMNSVGADRDAGGAEGVAADRHLQAGVLGGRRRLLQGVEAAVSSSPGATSYWTVASAARPSGLIAWLSNGLTTAATCGARPAAATTCSIAAA